MTKKKGEFTVLRNIRAGMVIILLIYIGLIFQSKGDSDTPFADVQKAVVDAADDKNMTLAGSLSSADRLVQTMVGKVGIPLEDAVRMAAETPARISGIADRKGTLEKGKDADIVILDSSIRLRCVFSCGEIVEGTNTMNH